MSTNTLALEALIKRSTVALACLPDAPYRAMLRQLHTDMLAAPKEADIAQKLSAVVKWLEENQPDVFRRGIWDAIAQPAAPQQAVQEPKDRNYVYPNFPELGYRIRTARKNHRCHGSSGCEILAGERYAVGESDPDSAGGFGRRIYCVRCILKEETK